MFERRRHPGLFFFRGSVAWPMRTPVNASPVPSRMPAHDSGSMWVATPSPWWTLTTYFLPVSRRTQTKEWAQKQVSCQDIGITIREGRHQFSWHKKQEQSRISPSDTVVMLSCLADAFVNDDPFNESHGRLASCQRSSEPEHPCVHFVQQAGRPQHYVMQHFLYFLPLPHGHKSFLPTLLGRVIFVSRMVAKCRFRQWR